MRGSGGSGGSGQGSGNAGGGGGGGGRRDFVGGDGGGPGPSSPPSAPSFPQHETLVFHDNDGRQQQAQQALHQTQSQDALSPVTPKRYHRREYEAGELASRSHDAITATSPTNPSLEQQYSAADFVGGDSPRHHTASNDGPRRITNPSKAATANGSVGNDGMDAPRLPDIRMLNVGNDGGNNNDGAGGGGWIALPARTSAATTTTTEISKTKTVTRTVTETDYCGGKSALTDDVPKMVTPRQKRRKNRQQPIKEQEQQQSPPPRTPPRTPTSEKKKAGADLPSPPPMDKGTPPRHPYPRSPNSTLSPSAATDDRPRNNHNMRYYQIAYRGVVSLLSKPDERSERSGVYVSYGEIVATSGEEIKVVVSSAGIKGGDSTTGTGDIATAIAIRVDDVLTGGYAVDAERPSSAAGGGEQQQQKQQQQRQQQQQQQQQHPEHGSSMSTGRDTPRRSNVTDGLDSSGGDEVEGGGDGGSPSVCGSAYSALTASDYVSFGKGDHHDDNGDDGNGDSNKLMPPNNHHGYLFLSRPSLSTPIAIGLSGPPSHCQPGPFLYRVVSSTPLPVIAGPCSDAPRTGQAVVMPGTIHQISLRMQSYKEEASDTDEVMYLRLSHRRGWLADRRSGEVGSVRTVMAEVIGVDHSQSGVVSDGHSVSVGSVSSFLSTSLGSVSTASRRRRRPPLRKRKGLRVASQDLAVLSAKPGKRLIGEDGNDPSSPQRQNGSFDYGFDCEGLGASFEQGSHQLSPTGTPMRRVNPALTGTASPVSVLSDENLRNNLSASSSFLDRSDRYTVAQTMSESTDNSAMNELSSEPSFFLMKATAPNGLKILDAPHFQVNNLIHGQGHAPSTMHKGNRSDGGFHTMAGTFASDPSILRTDSTDSSSRTRILPRGKLFEANQRLVLGEVSGLAYTPGAGLIKLADNSGWAIVPNKDELDAQYRCFRGGKLNVQEGEATQAFTEVGNAIINDSLPYSQTERPRVWLRIIHRGGVLVSCPPPPELADTDSRRASATGSSPHSSTAGSALSTSNLEASSDVATSSIASSFLDTMFRTPRKPAHSHGAAAGIQRNDSGLVSERSRLRSSSRKPTQTAVDAVIPCGLCVEVEPWERDPNFQDHPSFARLCGGQGWIPRHMNGQVFARTVDPPNIRKGSMWFRVKSKRGIKVRHGPSRRANSIKNEEGEYFRFECGEFLRASEVYTMKSDEDASNHAQHQHDNAQYQTYECFAKLYRNSHVRNNDRDGIDYRPLNSLAAPGEWVQVYGGGHLYLEECADPPKIERHRQCWRYNAVNDGGLQVRKGPSYLSEMTGKVLRAGESVLINERVTAHGETGAWLRLKDGNGWVHEKGEGGESVMVAHSLRHRTPGRPRKIRMSDDRAANEAAYNTIIARLFHEHEGESEEHQQQQKHQYR